MNALDLTALTKLARTDEHARHILADMWHERGRDDVARLWADQLPEAPRNKKRLDKLTKAQTAATAGWAKKWIEIGLSTERADRPLFEAGVAACYRAANLQAPPVIWCPSPLVATMAGPNAAQLIAKSASGEAVRDAVRGAVGGAVDVAVGGAVDDAVDDAVRDAVRDVVRGAVDVAVRGAVRGAVGDAVGSAVGDAVRGAVDVAVRGAVDVAVRGAVRGAVGDAVRGAVRGAVGDAVRGAVGGAVDDAVDDAVGGAVNVAVRGAVDDAVDDAVRGAVGGAVGAAVDDAVDDAVGGAVNVAVRGAVDDAVDDAVRGAVVGAVGGAVGAAVDDAAGLNRQGIEWWRYMGGQFWVGGWLWFGSPSTTSFIFDVCGLQIDPELELASRAYAATAMSACWWWPHSHFVMVSERPSVIEFHDAERRQLKRVQWEGWEVEK